MYLIRKYTSLGFKEIGEYFGGRDHTTIIHGLRRVVPGHEYASSVVGRYSADRLGSYRGRIRVSL
jgi:chromosomal replication initiation ATPase DnaA